MNSPPEPGSPSLSTPSSGSPPPDDANFQPTQNTTSEQFINIASHITHSFSGSSSKRRLPAGSSFGAASNRDPKSRRRVEPGRGNTGGQWEGIVMGGGGGGKREKEEFVDQQLVEYLRKEIGDPFA